MSNKQDLIAEIEASDKKTVVRVTDTYNHHNKIVRASFPAGFLDAPVANKYAESLVNHISHVREAGEMIGVNIEQLSVHDDSKWTHDEFPYYANNFHGDPHNPDAPDGFAGAWLHHVHQNPHHWQYWIFPDGFTPRNSNVENGVVQMPPMFALEMIADWMGASMAYTGSWDMQEWLWKNMPKIRVHSKTAEYLRGKLDMLGYADTVYVQKFAHEVNNNEQ